MTTTAEHDDDRDYSTLREVPPWTLTQPVVESLHYMVDSGYLERIGNAELYAKALLRELEGEHGHPKAR